MTHEMHLDTMSGVIPGSRVVSQSSSVHDARKPDGLPEACISAQDRVKTYRSGAGRLRKEVA